MSGFGSGFQAFFKEMPEVAQAHFAFVKTESEHSALDAKTGELAYLAVLASARMTSGIPFHVAQAKKLGASREEVASAIVTGLPAVGLQVLDALPIATAAYDEEPPH